MLKRHVPWITALVVGATSATLLAAPTGSTLAECQARLADPAPLTTEQRDWLETCTAAFTVVATSPAPTTPPAPTSTPIPPTAAFPSPVSTGVPAGWVPQLTRTTTLVVTSPNSVVQDIRINGGDLDIRADNVTVRRVEVIGGEINTNCRPTVLEDVSVLRDSSTSSSDLPAVHPGNYTARRVEINGTAEGFRVGCGQPVVIENSYALVRYPDQCSDWHGDTLQGYDGGALNVRNVTLEFVDRTGCGGTAPFFYPRGSNQGNRGPVHVNGLLVSGGGFSFRLGHAGTVQGLRIENNTWGYGPIDVRCSVLTQWSAQIVTVNSNYQVTRVRDQQCNTEAGS